MASNPPARLALHLGEELVAASDAGSSPSPRVAASATPNTLRVEIREVTPADEGSYRCTATNAHGTASRHLYFRVQSEYRVPDGLCPVGGVVTLGGTQTERSEWVSTEVSTWEPMSALPPSAAGSHKGPGCCSGGVSSHHPPPAPGTCIHTPQPQPWAPQVTELGGLSADGDKDQHVF